MNSSAPLFISPQQLHRLLSEPTNLSFLLVDIREQSQYATGHIENAVAFDSSHINIKQGDTSGLLPTPEAFNAAMSEIGLQNQQSVIIYDTQGGPPAGRFAWTLQAFGHNKVSILDGGFEAWQHADLPLTQTIPSVKRSAYQSSLVTEKIADYEYILKNLKRKDLKLLDARSPEEFRGEDKRAARSGHIPGAINLDWRNLKDPYNSPYFLNDEKLQQWLSEYSLNKDDEIICYCQSHQRSAILCIALESLGYENVKGYPGAWSDWGNKSNSPIET